jgi:hypothetical protein
MVLNNLGVLEKQELRYDLAQTFFDEGLALMREVNDRQRMTLVLANIGRLARMQRDPVRARPPLEEGLALGREMGTLCVLEAALSELAQVAMQQGDYATARAQFQEVLASLAASRNDMSVIDNLEPITELAVLLHRPRQGLRLFAAGVALRERSGMPVVPCDRADYERRKQLLRAALDEETFAQEWESGHALTREESIALAQEIL